LKQRENPKPILEAGEPMLPNVSNMLWDLDGTLTDPKEGITRCIRYALDRLGGSMPPADRLDWCIGPPLTVSFSRLLNTTDPAILDRALVLYRERFSTKGMFENRLYPGVASSLNGLRKAGFNLFLATSKPRVFARQILDHFRLTPLFHAVYGSELDGRLSDKGALIAHILHREGLDPAATLMVGDRLYDIEGGKENEVMTAAAAWGYGTRDEIAAANPDIVFETIVELTQRMMSLSHPRLTHDFDEGHLRRR
jgi:phosphoglycolate phosphatase